MKKGGGGRFAKLVGKLEKKGKSPAMAKGIAAKVGREKYGAKDMAKMAAAGKKRKKTGITRKVGKALS